MAAQQERNFISCRMTELKTTGGLISKKFKLMALKWAWWDEHFLMLHKSLNLSPGLGAGLTFTGENPAPQNLPHAGAGQLLYFKLSLLIHKIPPWQNHQGITGAQEHFLTVLRVTNHSGEREFLLVLWIKPGGNYCHGAGGVELVQESGGTLCFADEGKFETATWGKSKVILETVLYRELKNLLCFSLP